MALDLTHFLGQVGLFRDLSEADRAWVASKAIVASFKRGETVVQESSVGEDIFAIMRGRIDVTLMMPDGGTSETIATLGEGDVFGESILLGKTRRIAAATAKDSVEIVKWNCGDLERMFNSNPAVGFIVMRSLARIVHERLTATNMLLRNTLNRVVDLM